VTKSYSSFAARHVVILAHPASTSFNALVARTYCEAVGRLGQEAVLRDLYALGFDPVLKDAERPGEHPLPPARDVADELAIIQQADVVVLVYPIWFGAPPAMMKGYLDRVLGHGVTAQGLQRGNGSPMLKGKPLVSITSSGTSKFWLDQQHQLDALRTLFGDYLVHAFAMASHESLHFGETIDGLSPDFIDPLMGQVENLARRMCAQVETRSKSGAESTAS
jgi:NAD(P)H dehydrogenase (quinone)